MADEKKPGLLKRMFSFGFGKKKAEPEPETILEDNSAAEAESIAEAAALKETERLQAIKQAEEDALAASKLAAEKAEAEKQKAEEAAALKQAEDEAKRLAEESAAKAAEKEKLEKEAEAKRVAEEETARLEAEKQEAERLKAEELAAKQKAADEKLEQAKLAAEKADAEEAARLEIEAAKELDRLEAEREAIALQKTQDEAAEKARQEDEARRLAEEKAKQEKLEAEHLAQEETDRIAAEAAATLETERQAQEEAELAKQKASEEAARLQAEEEAARLEAERLEEERLEQERLEADARPHEDEEELAELEIDEVKVDAQPDETPENEEPEEERKVGWFKRLTKGLAKSSSALTENITSVFTKKKLDEDTLQELEDILIQADLGVETAMNITDTLASQRMGKDVTDEEVRQIMADEIEKVLEPVAQPLELDLDHQPHVVLVVGVNGSGKTTTIGKISQKLYNAGFSTLLVAGDTFRAAAVEQLHIWGDRTQAPVMSRPNGSDAAGLAFDAYTEAVEQKRDVMLMDTAGRLQNKKELMDELEKIIRVLKKQDPSAPHTVLLTLDATTGQNALNQVEIFKDVAGVNGLVMTKLDGTARGGILVSISAKHKLPVYFIGVGEQVEDLEPFEADVFAKAIAGIE